MEWFCTLVHSLALWYLTECVKSIIVGVSLVDEWVNLHFLISQVILVLSVYMPSLSSCLKSLKNSSLVPKDFLSLLMFVSC